jgi:hypothetical protein
VKHTFHNPRIATIAALAAMCGASMSYTGDTPAGVASDVNILPERNLYMGSPRGGSLATLGSAASPDAFNASPGGSEDVISPSVDTPVAGVHGIAWWVGLALIIGIILFAAKKTGNAGEFSNLRASTYNIALITLVAIVGLTGLKVVASKVKGVPMLSGFSQIVLAA